MSDRPMPPTARRIPGRRPFGDGTVPDDLAWMRDPAQRDALAAWLADERRWYDAMTRPLEPLVRRLTDEATARVAAGERSSDFTVGAQRYRIERPTGAAYERLVRVAEDGTDAAVVLDLDELAGGRAFARIGDLRPSPDGRWVAYTLDLTGSERYALRVREVATGSDRILPADGAYYGLAWSADSASVYAVTIDHADRPCRLWRHRDDGDRWAGELVLHEADERFHLTVRVAGDGRWLIARVASRLTAEEWAIDLAAAGAARPIPLGGRRDGRDDAHEPVAAADGTTWLLAVDERAGRDRLVRYTWDPAGAGRTDAGTDDGGEILLAGGPDDRFAGVTTVGETAIVSGRHDGQSFHWLVPLDRPGAATGIGPSVPWSELDLGRGEAPAGSIELVEEGRSEPATWWHLELATGRRSRAGSTGALGPEAGRFAVETVEVTAPDGRRIPVSLLHRADLPLDGTAPCLLYGYGAWELVTHPAFDPVLVSLLERGVVYAHARVRGGGELGRRWWREGRMERKSATFTDFAAVADHLAGGLVDGRRIVARGHSAGGLLMGTAWTDRPDRWAGVIAEVPFVDPVTTMSDPAAPLVIVERDEWGDPRRAEDRAWMCGWAPYERIPPGRAGPPLLVTTAIEDPRVSAWEPARWVARLREAGASPDAVLLRADLGPRGHWPPPGRSAGIAYQAEIGAWILDRMGIER